MKKLPMMPELRKPVPGRVCWGCKHVFFMNSDPGYSEFTPGTQFWFNCNKNYWDFNPDNDSLDDFRKCLMSAERCADFEPRS